MERDQATELSHNLLRGMLTKNASDLFITAGFPPAFKMDGKLTPALEILINTPLVKKLLEENRLDKLAAAVETGTDDGMLTFNQALFDLVKAGRVSEKEALSKATNPQALEMNFKGIFLNEGGRIVS